MGVNASSFRSVENAMSFKPKKSNSKNIFFKFGNEEREEHILRLVGDFYKAKEARKILKFNVLNEKN